MSGDSGCPGPNVLRAVTEDLSLAPDSATLLPRLEGEEIARGNPQSRGPATPDGVKVSVVLGKIIRLISLNHLHNRHPES